MTKPGVILTNDQGLFATSQNDEMQRIPYAEAISSVVWPAMISRPDISFAAGILMQLIQNPVR